MVTTFIYRPSLVKRGKGICGGAKIFGFALLQPARSVCVSLGAFFILISEMKEALGAIMKAGKKRKRNKKLSCASVVSHIYYIFTQRN